MPLQNRVSPFGDLFADPARGTFMGNRGGRIHDDRQRLGARRFASKQWICCVLEFKGRHRRVWGDSHTELFFLDEVTALAAGHRPCFECRRGDAIAFAEGWGRAFGTRPRAPQMDAVLHAERLDGKRKRTHLRRIDGLSDGAVIVLNGAAYAVKGDELLPWTASGYAGSVPRPAEAEVEVLTPPSIIAVLAAGYAPQWHASASR